MTTNQGWVFFTSDLHLGHEFVAGLRGFASAKEHDAAIFDNWHATVPAGAIVWVLGDVILPKLTENLAKLAELPGTKHLITGNHDKCHPHNRDSHKYRDPTPPLSPKSYFQVFATIQEFARRKINGQSVMLSHFPYPGGENSDHTLEPRFNQYRLPNEGLPILHGHTHSPEVISYAYANEPVPTLQIHVGLDAHGLKPVSLIQLTALLELPPGITSEFPIAPDQLIDRKSVWPQ